MDMYADELFEFNSMNNPTYSYWTSRQGILNIQNEYKHQLL